MIDIRMLQIISEIHKEGSFQKAAESLYLSQPALSQYVSRAEKELGFKIYNRIDGKCYLTEAGEIMLTQGEPIIEAFAHMLEDMKEVSRKKSGGIILGCPTAYTVPWFTGLLKGDMFTNTKIQMIEDNVETLIESILNKSIDMIFIPAVFKHKKLEYRTICKEMWYLAVPKGSQWDVKFHPEGSMVEIEQLKDIPFIMDQSVAYKYSVNSMMGEYVRENTVFEAKDWDIALQLVSEGVGVTLVPYWKTGSDRNTISYYPISCEENACRVFSVAYHKDREITSTMQVIIDYVIEKFGDSDAGRIIPHEELPLKF